MFADISGTFVKIALVDDLDVLISRFSPSRPAARFNRKGQDALYLSVNEDSARVAMIKHAQKSTGQRVLINYNVQNCKVVDLRHAQAQEMRSLASQDWEEAIACGREPTSWQMADKLRQSNAVGLIDPSRKNPKLWHLTLLRWNEKGAPTVTMIGEPEPISL